MAEGKRKRRVTHAEPHAQHLQRDAPSRGGKPAGDRGNRHGNGCAIPTRSGHWPTSPRTGGRQWPPGLRRNFDIARALPIVKRERTLLIQASRWPENRCRNVVFPQDRKRAGVHVLVAVVEGDHKPLGRYRPLATVASEGLSQRPRPIARASKPCIWARNCAALRSRSERAGRRAGAQRDDTLECQGAGRVGPQARGQ